MVIFQLAGFYCTRAIYISTKAGTNFTAMGSTGS